MYVIWRRRTREKYKDLWDFLDVGDVRVTPVVVESRRVDGKPKQEHIAVLPSFIERLTTEGDAVWYWKQLEEKLARLSNRIPPEEIEKIRAAIDERFPRPSEEVISEREARSAAHFNALEGVLVPKDEATRQRNIATNNVLRALRDSLKTGESCGKCGGKVEGTVYRVRLTTGRGLMVGARFTTGVVCETCARGIKPYYPRPRPCENCEREVVIDYNIPNTRHFCSTRCGQAHYRAERKTA